MFHYVPPTNFETPKLSQPIFLLYMESLEVSLHGVGVVDVHSSCSTFHLNKPRLRLPLCGVGVHPPPSPGGSAHVSPMSKAPQTSNDAYTRAEFNWPLLEERVSDFFTSY